MALICERGNASNSISSRFGKMPALVGLVILALLVCAGCSQHYCPTYASTTYHGSFTYAPVKEMTYKPVKVHEFKGTKVNKADKKSKSKTKIR